MPLYEFVCAACGRQSEVLVLGSQDPVVCRFCQSRDMKKLLSAHSSLSGPAKGRLPGPGDTTCCGSAPGHGNCSGPGSCCGGH